MIDLPQLSTIDNVKVSHKDFYLKKGINALNEDIGEEDGIGLVERKFNEVKE